MDATYAERYADLYRNHWWWRSREAVVLSSLRSLPRVSGPVLDIGCGDGLLFPKLAEVGEVWGVEPEEAIVSAATKATGRVHLGSFDGSFQPNREFGLILMLDVLEHLDDRPGALRRANELACEEGWLLLTVPALSWLWTHHDDLNHHRTRYTRAILRKEVLEAGFEIVRCDYYFHWTVPAKLAQRGFETFSRRSETPRVPPKIVNRFLLSLCHAEQRFLGRFGSLWGSSLLLVARVGCTRPPDRRAHAI